MLTLGFIILFLMIFFGYFGLVMFLLINAAIVRKRERPKLANRLGLLAGIGLLGFQLLQIVASYREIPRFIVEGARLIDLIALYFFGQFTIFLTSSLLYNLNCCKLDKKYIVVCGAGLKNGRTVTPLLRRRIIAALEFARRQEKLTGLMPMVIMSGGQGDDEQLSEAFAMKEAALNDGFPEDFLLLEECSTTTFGNLKCCDGIIRQREGKSVPVAFATNDYHLFRTGLSSRKLKMKAEGIPARTAPYFLPTAFLREFIAYLMSTKWVHVVLLTLMLIAYIYR
ncbi:MAG: YdcF family protein [Turicibacter sp.]|nr:YdcF family protein [Turicibacter sp.]